MDGGKRKRVKILIKGILTRIGKERGKIKKGNVEKEERKKNIREEWRKEKIVQVLARIDFKWKY